MKKTRLISMVSICFILPGFAGKKKAAKPAPPSPPLVDYFNPEAAKQLLDKGINELVFIKRYTLNASDYYAEYMTSTWLPGGNLCVLDLQTGNVRDLVPELNGGVFNRFDISFDAKKIAFDYKASAGTGYRIYEINIDGTGLRQLTFTPENEAELVALYGTKAYHHGTDDMHPCYLPDGGFAFVSTRVHQGVLCRKLDNYTTKTLYRMEADGSQLRKLSSNALSEAAPVMMADGRILYHRWEYNDKASSNLKCLWAMYPNGTGSVEVFGNTLTAPDTIIYGRPIPNKPSLYVALVTSNKNPNNALGSVVLIDAEKNTRTRKPLTYITKDIDAPVHTGFTFLVDGKWIHDTTGRPGRLFKDPYPVSEDLFIAPYKPKGFAWDDPNAYDLALLDLNGETTPLYQTKDISCWHPMALLPRANPSLASPALDPNLASENRAECVVTDIYVGMPGVERGTIKYIRVMEQVGRPWTARTRWKGDVENPGHTAVGIGHLGIKVQWGVVPVEEDGSAYFKVPADRNIYFQALDENYMMVQTERTIVNYMPGERRSCIGCHEQPKSTPSNPSRSGLLALKRSASIPGPQRGEAEAKKVFDYTRQIQPIWNKHCVSCHSGDTPEGDLDLSDEFTILYLRSYENLMQPETEGVDSLIGEYASTREVSWYDLSYREAYYSGSHTAPLTVVLSNGKIPVHHPDRDAIMARLVPAHKDVKVSPAEFLKVVNWIDSFGQFYPSYWCLKNKAYKDQDFFRPEVAFDEVISTEIPARFRPLYDNPPKGIKVKAQPKRKRTTKK
ncbi:HzsA-related protein [Pontiella sulfatireligans]|uniref:Cytochrome c domain-containing protein n=1 Tax=Pontiella sulfatireligans TaxID=2750658 RepID=A0A6C2UHB7_9BACT|nr:hypothetical protein [Pontiella sulfatireligans]VGO18744.1 hypothetical protein SCARR_00797 [Pontiella sulfatireligans]